MKPIPAFTPVVLAVGLLLTAAPAFAQLAEGLDTPEIAPAEAPDADAKAAETPVPAIQDSAPGPSRYAGGELSAYVRQLTSRFSIRQRVTDPFGRHQDPDFVAPEPKIVTKGPTRSFKPEPPTPFSDVVAGITINTVIPAKQRFLIGNREFGVNDSFSLRLPNGKELKVTVLAVSSSRIRFRNLTTNETANLTLNLLPAGMQKGTGTLTAPGVEPGGADAPIEIQPVVPLSNNH